MIDKSEIRNEILGRIDSIDINLELESKLDSLTFFNENNELDMKSFYSDFSNIINLSEINIFFLDMILDLKLTLSKRFYEY